MTVREDTTTTGAAPLAGRWDRLEYELTRLLTINGEVIAYTVIFILAVLTRFWDLGVRVMSHDESLHTRYSWNLYRGEGFSHTPLMHGPLLFHMTALSYLLFGDTDFTSRIYPAVVGIIVVMMPVLMRKWLGKVGALAASFFFLISPLILYYSRYIRHDMPAIFGALIMAVSAWRYIEGRSFRYLIALAIGQAILYASKEVSFIYIAIFGSFLTLYFIARLLDVRWENPLWRRVFAGALIAVLLLGLALGVIQTAQGEGGILPGGAETGTAPLADPSAPTNLGAPTTSLSPLALVLVAALGLALVAAMASVMIGQWRRLRDFPELDVAMVMGTLILPSLTPFLLHFAGYNPMDSSPQGVRAAMMFTVPIFLIAALIGLTYFMTPPQRRQIRLPARPTDEEIAGLPGHYDPQTNTVTVEPDLLDWLSALSTSRWWAIGGPYWLFFIFFFTTMFTNGSGIGTGLIGSLGYWLEQQGVKRGNQPWYYYIMFMVPLYEFLPLILSVAAGALGLRRWLRPRRAEATAAATAETDGSDPGVVSAPPRQYLDPAAPISFPVLLFVGYWAVMNFLAYSIAGEKMPWLTTHLTTPMILLAGWVTGQLLTSIPWRRIWRDNGWVLFVLIPVLAVALLRAIAPVCGLWEANPLCNTIIPESYQQGVLAGQTINDLAATGTWLAAVLVTVGVLSGVLHHVGRVGAATFWRLVALFAVGWLTFMTAQASWRAAYINYDDATEFLVYAHSSGAVKDVMEQIEEISLKTTDGLGLRVAYDNRVSWPYSWYLRDYYNAIYYGEEASRGMIGDAPVILAGADKWPQIEAITGDRYYQFEYIRMWWPMQDYFGYEQPAAMVSMLKDVLRDPDLQRGLWEIFAKRDYEAYADAVADYRGGNRPSFKLSEWPVPDRMRVYIRKDIFAQVWDYGVAASEIAEAIDPYAENVLEIAPSAVLGQGVLNRPHGVAIGPDGLFYVADSQNHRIAVLDADGSLVRTMGSYGVANEPGAPEDALNEPWGVAVDANGMVYVADTWNHRVVVFDQTGQFVRAWGFEGALTDNTMAFWGPRAIAVDNEDRVYVADTGNKRIMVYQFDGDFLRQIGGGGVLEGQLEEPVGLAFGPDGNLYVADTWNQRIQVFTPEGVFVRQWPFEGWFAQTNERPYLDVDEAGSVYVTDPEGSRVVVFDSEGTFRYSFGDLPTVGIAGGIAVGAEGEVYVTDAETGTLRRFDIAPPAGGAPVEETQP